MFCIKCGVEIPDNSTFCAYCGTSQTGNGSANPQPATAEYVPNTHPEIKTHLVGSILVTLFCCMPLGVIAIINASRVSGLIAANRLNEAYETSQKAATWMWWGFGLGIVAQLIGIAIHIIIGIAEAMAETGNL